MQHFATDQTQRAHDDRGHDDGLIDDAIARAAGMRAVAPSVIGIMPIGSIIVIAVANAVAANLTSIASIIAAQSTRRAREARRDAGIDFRFEGAPPR